MSLIRVYTYPLAAGVAQVLPGGRYFRLVTADAPVDVELFNDAGESIGVAVGIKGGFEVGIEPSDIGIQARLVGFSKATIKSATIQTVDVAIGRQPVRYDRLAGNVTASLAKGILPWEGRNPLPIHRDINALGVAPPGPTTQWTYTIPAAKQFAVQSFFMQMIRITAAAPIGRWVTQFERAGVAIARVSSFTNVVGDRVSLQIPSFIIPSTGVNQIINLITLDGSTGGTVDYHAVLDGIEFDA